MKSMSVAQILKFDVDVSHNRCDTRVLPNTNTTVKPCEVTSNLGMLAFHTP